MQYFSHVFVVVVLRDLDQGELVYFSIVGLQTLVTLFSFFIRLIIYFEVLLVGVRVGYAFFKLLSSSDALFDSSPCCLFVHGHCDGCCSR